MMSTEPSEIQDDVEQKKTEVEPENDRLEYKSLRIKDRDMSVDEVLKMFRRGDESKQKEFNAMLNYGGGEVHFGIGEVKQPDGSKKCIVEDGVKLTNEEKMKIEDAIHRTFSEFYPSCQPDRGDYEVKWLKTGIDGNTRYRFTIFINRCSAYKSGRIVCMNNVPSIVAYTRSGTASLPMSADMIQEKLKRVAVLETAAESERLTQACIDAKLIQRLRDALDKYEENEIGANDIIRILHKYETEMDRQRHKSYILAEEILQVMDALSHKTRSVKTEIAIAAEIVKLSDCLYYAYVFQLKWPNWHDSEICDQRNVKNLARNIVSPLFEVCFSVAHDCVKYRGNDEVFATAIVVMAKILGTLMSAKKHEKDGEITSCFNELDQRYKQLESSIQESRLDSSVKQKLHEFQELLLQRYFETDYDKQYAIEEKMMKLHYSWA